MANQITFGNFSFTDTSIEGVKVVDVKSYGDSRGYFMETYKRSDSIVGGIDCEFVQDNQSASTGGLRGLHFQIEHPQSKLVRVVQGRVFDVCVDLRPGSKTYGKWEGGGSLCREPPPVLYPSWFCSWLPCVERLCGLLLQVRRCLSSE